MRSRKQASWPVARQQYRVKSALCERDHDSPKGTLLKGNLGRPGGCNIIPHFGGNYVVTFTRGVHRVY
jgi:hypothetical protein